MMVETTAYFEAYRYILKALQETNEADIPFRNNILMCSQVMNPPRYLLGAAEPHYDLRPLTREAGQRAAEREEAGDEGSSDEEEVCLMNAVFVNPYFNLS